MLLATNELKIGMTALTKIPSMGGGPIASNESKHR